MSKKRRSSTNSNQSLLSSKLVDIVIPVHRRFDLLGECLKALPAACGNLPYEVILVDNASPKEEANPFYSSLDNSVMVVRNQKNDGFPKACNQGANRRKSPLIFFLNSDVVLEKDAVVELVKALDDPEVGVAGAKLLFPEGTPHGPSGKIQHVGLASDINGTIIHQFIGWSPDHPKVKRVKDTLAVTGAALMVRRSLFKEVGGFYEGYGMGTWEDVDLCMFVLSRKRKVVVVQEALGTHYVGGTSTKYQIQMPMNQNRLIFLSRWGGHYPWTEYLYA